MAPPVPLLIVLGLLSGASFLTMGPAASRGWRGGVAASALLFATGLFFGDARVRIPRVQTVQFLRSAGPDALIEIHGVISDVWGRSGLASRTQLRVTSCRIKNLPCPFSAPLVLIAGGETDVYGVAGFGDSVRVRGQVRVPDARVGPFGPVRLPPDPIMYLKSASQIEKLEGPGGFFARVQDLHVWLALRILEVQKTSQPHERRALGLVMALVLGETSGLQDSDISAFRDGGVAHVLAVSGLQVALLAAAVYAGLTKVRLGLISKDVLLIAFTVSYAFLAGANSPVMRSALTICVYFTSRIAGRPTSPWQAVGLSALAILFVSPEGVFDVGFLLSYSAILGLSGIYPLLARGLSGFPQPFGIASVMAATFAAELAVLPIQAYVFHSIPVLGLLSNLVVVPVSTAFLFASVFLLPFLLWGGLSEAIAVEILVWLSEAMFRFLGFLEAWGPTRLIPQPAFWEALLLAGLLILLGLSRNLGARIGSACGVAFLAFWILVRPFAGVPAGEVRLGMIDVGQGDSWLLGTDCGNVLIDGGGSYEPGPGFGRRRLLPRLSRLGAVSFDAVVLTHPDPDHARGLLAVLAYAPVKTLILPRSSPRNVYLEEILAASSRRRVPVLRVGAGEEFWAAGLRFAVIHPSGDPGGRRRSNNSSLVFSVEAAGRHMLFTGDVEARIERELLEKQTLPRAAILKIAHHGSGTSSTEEFLDAVSPRVGLIGVGLPNRFGHPNAEVIARLEKRGVRIWRTDTHGDLLLIIRNGTIFPMFEEENGLGS